MKKLNRNEKIYYTILRLYENKLIRLNINELKEKNINIYDIEFKNKFLNEISLLNLLKNFFFNNENEIKEKYYLFIEFYYINTKNLYEIDYLINLFIKEYF